MRNVRKMLLTRAMLLILILVAAAIGCGQKLASRSPDATTTSVVTAEPEPKSDSKLLWSDEFNALDLASPAHPEGFWRPNDFWQNLAAGYQDFAGSSWNINPNEPTFAPYAPFSTTNGILTVRAVRTPPVLKPAIKTQMTGQGIPGEPPAWSGGMLVQNPAVKKFKYGYFEFRARWPKTGRGMFPALWLYSSDQGVDVNGKNAAEIDVLEMFASDKEWTTTLHLKGTASNRSVTLGSKPMDAANFHVYALDWQPKYIKIYRDGELMHSLEGPDAAWFNSPMGLRINYAMDAYWMIGNNIGSDGTTPPELTMELDYVRVYTRKP